MAENDRQLVATRVQYLSQGDETSFFEWLQRIKCVGQVRGQNVDLFISLTDPPTQEDLRELIALFHRYDVDMRQLARFAKWKWVKSPIAYWHERMFA